MGSNCPTQTEIGNEKVGEKVENMDKDGFTNVGRDAQKYTGKKRNEGQARRDNRMGRFGDNGSKV